MSITICDTHLTRTVRYLSLTFEPVYLNVQHWCFNFIELTHLCMDKSIFTIPL